MRRLIGSVARNSGQAKPGCQRLTMRQSCDQWCFDKVVHRYAG